MLYKFKKLLAKKHLLLHNTLRGYSHTPGKLTKRGDNMEIVTITPESVVDLKAVMENQAITQETLRISVNMG